MLNPIETHDDSIARALERNGWSLELQAASPELIAELRADATRLLIQGEFRPAGIGAGQTKGLNEAVRGDRIHWWAEAGDGPHSPAQSKWISRLDHLRRTLNETLYLGLSRMEVHYAYYPAGKGYQPHLDVPLKGKSGRVVSTVLYLNDDWKPEHQGQLVLYPENSVPVAVAPKAGTLACFLSREVLHEVKPNFPGERGGRWSVTAWLGTR